MAKFEEISFTSAHEIKADRRILKTKKAIYEALVELMQKKKLNSITVTELAAQADINRKTFYTYYSTVNDVLDEGTLVVLLLIIALGRVQGHRRRYV